MATCAEVAAIPETGSVKLLRVVSAFECGAVVNPDHLKTRSKARWSWGSAARFSRRSI